MKISISIVFAAVRQKAAVKKEQAKREEEMRHEANRLNAEAERRINEQITAVMQYNSRIRSEMSKLEESYKALVLQNVEKAFDPVISSLEEGYRKNKGELDNAGKQLSEIDSILDELTKIKTSIG